MPDPLPFQKYPDPRRQNLYRLLCDILRDLDLHHPERSQYAPATFERLNALAPEDWPLLARMAEAEGVAPLIYWAVKGSQELRSEFDEETYTTLKQSYYTSAAHNTLLFQELERILQTLDKYNIPVILLKGAALAQTLYPDPALRPMNDLDILINKQAVDQVVHILNSLNYSALKPDHTQEFKKILNKDIHLFSLDIPEVSIEIHWDLISSQADWRNPPIEWFLSQSEVFQKNKYSSEMSINLYMLAPMPQILYLCAHLMLQHGTTSGQLVWYYDIFLGMSNWQERIDLLDMANWGKEFHFNTALYLSLKGLHELFKYDIDPEYLSGLIESKDEALFQFIKQKSKVNQTRTVTAWNTISSLNSQGRLIYILSFIFPSREYMIWRYKIRYSRLYLLYYPYRWIDLSNDLLKTVLKSRKLRINR